MKASALGKKYYRNYRNYQLYLGGTFHSNFKTSAKSVGSRIHEFGSDFFDCLMSCKKHKDITGFNKVSLNGRYKI